MGAVAGNLNPKVVRLLHQITTAAFGEVLNNISTADILKLTPDQVLTIVSINVPRQSAVFAITWFCFKCLHRICILVLHLSFLSFHVGNRDH